MDPRHVFFHLLELLLSGATYITSVLASRLVNTESLRVNQPRGIPFNVQCLTPLFYRATEKLGGPFGPHRLYFRVTRLFITYLKSADLVRLPTSFRGGAKLSLAS